MIGVDAAHLSLQWTGHDALFFDLAPTMDKTTDVRRTVALPRIGLDLGGKTVRVRPMLEGTVDARGNVGADVTVALAARF